MFAVPLVPGVVERSALEDEGDQEPETIDEHGGDDSPANVMKARRDFSGEDAEVEEDDRDFCSDDDDLVEPLLDVKVLSVMVLVSLRVLA